MFGKAVTDPSLLAALVSRLRADPRSLRQIAREDYPETWHGGRKVVSYGTLAGILKGSLPKHPTILRALGLVEKRRRSEVEKQITKMARATKKKVLKDWRMK